MMRLSAALVLAVCIGIVGCGGTPETGDPTPAKPNRKGTIGFSALTLTNPFFKIIAETMKEEADKHGYDVIVVSADGDVRKQADQIQEFIVKGVAAIVLNPCDSQSIGPAIAQA